MKMKIVSILMFVIFCHAQKINVPKICYSCDGVNCLRTLHNSTEKCLDALDFCVTIFEKSQVVRRGCFSSIPDKYRYKCELSKNIKGNCHKCFENKCNNINQSDTSCIQCNSDLNPDCKTNPAGIQPKLCKVSSAANSYCYVKYENERTTRGCSVEVAEQKSCFNNTKCMLCLPKDVEACNKFDFEPDSIKSLFIF